MLFRSDQKTRLAAYRQYTHVAGDKTAAVTRVIANRRRSVLIELVKRYADGVANPRCDTIHAVFDGLQSEDVGHTDEANAGAK